MTPARRKAIEASLKAGMSPEKIKEAYLKIVRRKRSWLKSEKAMAISDWDRDVDEVVRSGEETGG